jgi:hypothetical protein
VDVNPKWIFAIISIRQKAEMESLEIRIATNPAQLVSISDSRLKTSARYTIFYTHQTLDLVAT